MTESESEDTDSGDYGDMDEEQVQELVDRVSRELESRDKERISASMGMMSLEIHSHQSLEDAHSVFEDIWRARVQEIQDAESTTKRELEEQGPSVFQI